MHHHRRHVIRHAWGDFEMGYLARGQAEAIELRMLADQRREREQCADMKVIVDCCRCGVPIEVPALAYRGGGRHACADCAQAAFTGYARVQDEEVAS